jgi:acyl transferase domain-containing protein
MSTIDDTRRELMRRVQRLSPARRALLALELSRRQGPQEAESKREPIAIIGIGCRVPGADSPEQLWQLLCAGTDAITEVPPERWDLDAYFDPDPEVPGKMTTRWGGFVDRADTFDAGFFGISPREAVSMDPQQRLLLEVTWEALEDAGVPAASLEGSRTGVFIGIANEDYSRLRGHDRSDLSAIDLYAGTGTAYSVAAGRIAFFLGLQGPTMAIDTACSASLVAVRLPEPAQPGSTRAS